MVIGRMVRGWGLLVAALLVSLSPLPASAAVRGGAAVSGAQAAARVSKIAVVNHGGYVFHFKILWMDDDFGWHDTAKGWDSGKYPVGQTRTSPSLAELGVPEDAFAVAPYGWAVAGKSGFGEKPVRFDPRSGAVATYQATGTTLIGFKISLIG
jgi:hypothetical protein